MKVARFVALAVTTSLIGLTALPANAQEAAKLPQNSPNSGQADDGAVAPVDTVVGDIIVTAQRRVERTRDIPISIQSLDGGLVAARGITKLDQIGQLTTNLEMARTSGHMNPFLRGVGSRAAGPGDESTVSIYVDGVYQPSPDADYNDFNNIERLEVLKGPQGTLFGRNSSGGAINIITSNPSLTETSGNISASYGRFNNVGGSLYISTPLSDKFAINLAASGGREDGYYYNLITNSKLGDAHHLAIRGKLLFKPIDNLTIIVQGHGYDTADGKLNMYAPIDGNTIARRTDPNVVVPTKPYDVAFAANFIPSWNTDGSGESVSITLDAKPFQIVSLTGHEFNRTRFQTDSDGTAINAASTIVPRQTDSSWDQELRFVSPGGGPFSWVAGLYGYWDNSNYDPLINGSNGATASTVYSFSRVTSFAGFGQGTYTLGKISLTGGLRYTWEKRDYEIHIVTATVANARAHKEFTAFSPRASIQYKFDTRSNVYFTYSQGFKSGLFNSTSTLTTPVRPERLTSYELGIKSQASNSLRIDAAGFYYDYRDLQVQSRAQNGTTQLQNAQSAELYGAELTVTASPVRNLTVDFGAAWLHARYTGFAGAQVLIPRIINGKPAGNDTVFLDESGQPLVKAPEWSGNLGLTYKIPTGFGSVVLNGNASYASGFNWEVSGRLREPEHTLLNASIVFNLEKPKIDITFWGNNLTDVHQAIFYQVSGNGDTPGFGRPIDFGLTISKRF